MSTKNEGTPKKRTRRTSPDASGAPESISEPTRKRTRRTASRSVDVERLYKQLEQQAAQIPPERRVQLSAELQRKHTARISGALRQALAADGRSWNAIARAAGVNAAMVYRFRDGRSIDLETADRLADVLRVNVTLERSA